MKLKKSTKRKLLDLSNKLQELSTPTRFGTVRTEFWFWNRKFWVNINRRIWWRAESWVECKSRTANKKFCKLKDSWLFKIPLSSLETFFNIRLRILVNLKFQRSLRIQNDLFFQNCDLFGSSHILLLECVATRRNLPNDVCGHRNDKQKLTNRVCGNHKKNLIELWMEFSNFRNLNEKFSSLNCIWYQNLIENLIIFVRPKNHKNISFSLSHLCGFVIELENLMRIYRRRVELSKLLKFSNNFFILCSYLEFSSNQGGLIWRNIRKL